MSSNEKKEVVVRVISQKGSCSAGHKVGDEFILSGYVPEGMCAWAFYTLFPFASALMFGGKFPWEKNPDKSIVACPDPANPVVFEIERQK